jgi:hypothetical protein
MKRGNLLLCLTRAVLGGVALMLGGNAALAQEKTAPPAVSAPAIKDQRALDLLRGMSDTLAKAKTLSFGVRALVPLPAPTGQFVSLFGVQRVLMQRPDKLFVQTRGDLFASNLFYDGKTVTAVGLGEKFYAQRAAAAGGIDAMLRDAQPGADSVAPFFDVLVSDPYAVLTLDLATALWVGQSTMGGVKTEHLAFTGTGVEWEIWIGSADRLPRLLIVSRRVGERQPTFTAEFSDWKLDAPIAARSFDAVIPKGAVRLEFKPGAPSPVRP